MDLFQAMLRRFVGRGSLTIIDHTGVRHSHSGEPGPAVTLKFHDAKVARDLLLNPELKAGEAYMDGRLTIEQGTLRDFLSIYALNRTNLRAQPIQKALRRGLKTLKRWARSNTTALSKKNVEAHYDLSNEMYRLFLDEGLNYSCAYFRSADDTLEQAQVAKLRHIAAKLDLKPGQRVLDIGSGWGSMAIYLAENCGVEVVGVTLSKEQRALAIERAAAKGLSDRVRFELMDYRDVEGPFDRIVSVGMFEHVGVKNFPAFFAKVSKLLKPDGVALLHSIGRKGGPGITGAWVKKYIFPGGYSPALSETLTAIEGAKLWATDIEIWRMHYADTLVHWERRFQQNRAQAAALLGERFCRMWEFYLITAEFSFRHGKHMVFQIQLTKDVDAVPKTRDYLGEAEARLQAGERRPD
ncbi:cyclopropane-fatty-acyl-phospholipid synthase [Methylopila capsulata]|uniref:Cyclopropane-fatty-acyl-phospholipid synthase n=1 Tax=Methylopila capsulata TaxID=61654 RepID=A0A9W6MQX3_9HYPH|nr:cyclopropane-fatty-acyl-phospholipid synthase family protein [Methylopila capsulata]MBM7851628.1 cyclopropane-fatty-acyl-phospholipid synthase [Methylopila capsulata]GLK54688.1 cyclopropane-fatty-acyl-phospholipid synthase [Methylopila capsulata]